MRRDCSTENTKAKFVTNHLLNSLVALARCAGNNCRCGAVASTGMHGAVCALLFCTAHTVNSERLVCSVRAVPAIPVVLAVFCDHSTTRHPNSLFPRVSTAARHCSCRGAPHRSIRVRHLLRLVLRVELLLEAGLRYRLHLPVSATVLLGVVRFPPSSMASTAPSASAEYHVPPPEFDKDISTTVLTKQEADQSATARAHSDPSPITRTSLPLTGWRSRLCCPIVC